MTPTPIQPKRGMGVGTRSSLQARHCSVNHTVNCRPLTFKHSNPPSGTAASFCPADRDPCVKFTLFRPPCKNHGKNAPRLHRPGGLPPGPGPGGVPRTGPARRQARRAGDFSLAHGLAPPIRNQGNRSPHENVLESQHSKRLLTLDSLHLHSKRGVLPGTSVLRGVERVPILERKPLRDEGHVLVDRLKLGPCDRRPRPLRIRAMALARAYARALVARIPSK